MKGEQFTRPIYEEEKLAQQEDPAPPPNLYAILWCIAAFSGIALGISCLLAEPDLDESDSAAFACVVAFLLIELASFSVAGASIVCCALGSCCTHTYEGMHNFVGVFVVCGMTLTKAAHVVAVPVCLYLLFTDTQIPTLVQVYIALEMLIGSALVVSICSCGGSEEVEAAESQLCSAQELRFYENEVREARSNSRSLERITELSVRGSFVKTDKRSNWNPFSYSQLTESSSRSMSIDSPMKASGSGLDING
jgi:hypothetical protein